MEALKRCRSCASDLPLGEFWPQRAECKACLRAKARARYKANPVGGAERGRKWREANRERHNERQTAWLKANPHKRYRYVRNGDLKKKYGISLAQYEMMVEVQGGRCANLGCDFRQERDPTQGQPATLYVDHDHQTGRIRGLLCRDCNLAAGILREDIDRLTGLIAYLTAVP